jgi:hypothetical protein
MRLNRRAFVAAVGAATIAGCTSDSDSLSEYQEDPEGGTETGTPTAGSETTRADTTGESESSPVAESTPPPASGEPYGTPPATDPRLPLPMSRGGLREEARSGGPPKDGIPSIDSPTFEEAGNVSLLDDGDVVFGLIRNGVAKAYPQTVLVSHEICNDTVDGEPVAVTYCPLTGTAMGFERGETTFGVSGRLINNNLVMYDREHEAWWPQVLASSIPGPWEESPPAGSLREFRLIWTTWERWRDQHPDTRVLTGDTDRVRDYGRDPYGSYNPIGGYYEEESTLFPRLNPDDRFHPKRMLLGARTAEGSVAFPRPALREKKTVAGELGGDPVVAVLDPRFGTGYVYRNPEGAEVTVEDGRAHLDGSAYDPDALPLDRVHAFDAMWFAWSGFYPGSNVHE